MPNKFRVWFLARQMLTGYLDVEADSVDDAEQSADWAEVETETGWTEHPLSSSDVEIDRVEVEPFEKDD
jgi:hypothetical protein